MDIYIPTIGNCCISLYIYIAPMLHWGLIFYLICDLYRESNKTSTKNMHGVQSGSSRRRQSKRQNPRAVQNHLQTNCRNRGNYRAAKKRDVPCFCTILLYCKIMNRFSIKLSSTEPCAENAITYLLYIDIFVHFFVQRYFFSKNNFMFILNSN